MPMTATQLMPAKFKSSCQSVLKQFGLYNRIKESIAYDLYWRIAEPSVVKSIRKETQFYKSLLKGLRRNDLIFDVGANQGVKTGVFLELGARVVAVEPDELNQEILQEKFLNLRFRPRPVVIVGKALSDSNSVESMWVDELGSAKNSLSRKWVETLRNDETRFGHTLGFAGERKVETTTLRTLIELHGAPLFIKIDVEGYELNVLKGMHYPVPYLSFEVNLPEFRTEGVKCIEVLKSLSPRARFNYVVDCAEGFKLRQWVGAGQFTQALNDCPYPSIEVFWDNSCCA